LDSFTQRARRGEAHGAAFSWHGEIKSREQGTCVASTLIVDFSEIAGAEEPDIFGKAGGGFAGRRIWLAVERDPDYLSELTVSFLRPCARRRESTARPSAVFMRFRKPCTLARRRLFG